MEQQVEKQDDELAEFVAARQRELDEQLQKKGAQRQQEQWQEQGQAQGADELSARLQAERERLHQAGLNSKGEDNQEELTQNQNEKADLAAPRAGMQGSFASNQLAERAAERREFEAAEGESLMVCDVTPEDVQPLAKHEQAHEQQKSQSLGM